jgi:hypothetical protein
LNLEASSAICAESRAWIPRVLATLTWRVCITLPFWLKRALLHIGRPYGMPVSLLLRTSGNGYS